LSTSGGLRGDVSELSDPRRAVSVPTVRPLTQPRWRSGVADRVAAAERHPVLAVFAVALAVRVVVAVAVYVGWGGSLFLDDATYSQMAQQAADGTLTGVYPLWLYERTGSLLVPVTGLYEVLGPVELAGQLYVALLGAAAAALTVRLALEVVDRRWAIAAGLVVALLPSQILWSSLIMKDAAVWLTLAGLAVIASVASRTTGWRLAVLGVAAVALLAALGFLRLQTLEVACVALVLASLVGSRRAWLVRLAGAVALLVCIPYAFGMGPAGVSYVSVAQHDVGAQRAKNAKFADSAIVGATSDSLSSPTAGSSSNVDAKANISYLPRGVTAVALRPWPWEGTAGSLGLQLARLENLAWYPLLVFALLGLTAVWRNRQVLAFPVLCCGAILIMYGLTEGNLGTAFRHRGEVVWMIALLAALGAERLVRWRRERREQSVVAA
jgi:hypothetical protein